jgi:hypothetical protein
LVDEQKPSGRVHRIETDRRIIKCPFAKGSGGLFDGLILPVGQRCR